MMHSAYGLDSMEQSILPLSETTTMNIKVAESFLVVALLSLYFVKGSSGQNLTVSYEKRPQEELLCNIDETDISIQWQDTSPDPVVPIYIYNGNPPPTRLTFDDKYINFNYTLQSGSSFNLTIKDVERNDEGVYVCSRTVVGAVYTVSYSLSVEVPVTPVISQGSTIIDDSVDLILGSSSDLTCSAIGAKSVNDLQLMFSFETDGNGTTSVVNGTDPTLTDYTKTVSYTPDDKTLKSLSCSILGYGEVTKDENNVRHTVGLSVQYSPECILDITDIDESDDYCTIQMTCSCSSVPDVRNCTFYEDEEELNLTADLPGCSVTHNVTINTTTNYSCRATNDVGTGESEPVEYECYEVCGKNACQNDGKCREDEASEEGFTCDCVDCFNGILCELMACARPEVSNEVSLTILEGSSCTKADTVVYSSGTRISFLCKDLLKELDGSSTSSSNCNNGTWHFSTTSLSPQCKTALWFIIVLVVVGVLVVVALAVAIYCFCQKKKNKERLDGEDGKYNSAFTGDGGGGADDRPDWDDIDTKKETDKPAAAAEPPIYAESTKRKKSTKKETDEPASAAEPPIYAESTKRKKSQKSRDNGTPDPHVPMENSSAYEGVEFKGKSQPEAEPKELQYAELEHKTIPAGSEIIQSPDEPTPYADIKGTMEDVI